MATYKLILDGLTVFDVEITTADGFKNMRGFPTEAAALLWIAEQWALEGGADTEGA